MADLVLQCDACHGMRFRQDILEVKYRDKNIYDSSIMRGLNFL